MLCPKCEYKKSSVIDSRSVLNSSIRRRRLCLRCEHRFTTHEYRQGVMQKLVEEAEQRIRSKFQDLLAELEKGK